MSTMRSLAIVAFLVALCGCGVAAAEDEAVDTSDAMAAANEWLALVDRGRGREAYEMAAESFRKGIEQLKWEVATDNVRNTLGNVVARKLRTATFTRTLPGAPDGEYVLFYFDTRFEKKALATELVTSERENGTWRVGGYWVR